MRRTALGWIMVGCLGTPAAVAAQEKFDTVTAGPQYDVSPFVRLLAGSNWRDVWTTPIRAKVLDLGTFAGGLTPFQAGGNQSLTLRFHGRDGRTYVFRGTDKDAHNAIADDLKHTPVGDVIQDQSSGFHPTGHVIVAALQAKLNLLQAVPEVVLMPDDPRLGEFQKKYGGLVGTIEVRPDEVAEGTELPFGAKDIDDTEKLIEELEQSLDHRMDTREFLAARLIDFLIGDIDRGADQWRWARFDRGELKLYRPIPRDRDYAFLNANGLMVGLGRGSLPKIQAYKSSLPKLSALTFMTSEFDRTHFAGLSWSVWDSVITRVTTALDNATIREAVLKVPPEYFAINGEQVIATLTARRDGLRDRARQYYDMVTRDVDVFASEERDLAIIDRQEDGSVRVRLYSERAAKAPEASRDEAFDRTFVPSETHEIRIFMDKKDDKVIVRGASSQGMKIRIIGGSGDDVLIDSSRVARGKGVTVFYDARGKNEFVTGPATRINEKPYYTLQPKKERDSDVDDDPCYGTKKAEQICEERRGRFQDLMNTGKGFLREKLGSGHRTWGRKSGISPGGDLVDGTGVVLGLTRTTTAYGFRHDPYNTKVSLGARVGPGNGRAGVELRAEVKPENSRLTYGLQAHASQLESNRFPGYGNDTELLDPLVILVKRDELLVHPSIRVKFGSAHWISVGPVVRYTDPEPVAGSPASALSEMEEPFGQVGAQLSMRLDGRDDFAAPRKGFTLTGAAAYYPATWDVTSAYTTARLQGTAYIPFGSPVLALRLGGARVFGDAFPLHDAATIGGSSSLRGFRRSRFVGDTEVHGSAEVRLPLGRVTLLTRGTLGVLGFVDAGRVWFDDASAGDWHTGVGGGLSFATLGSAVSVSYAHGEQGRFYVRLGMPF